MHIFDVMVIELERIDYIKYVMFRWGCLLSADLEQAS